MVEMIPILLGLGFFSMIAWIVYVVVDGNRRKERLKVFTDFHSKLIDRMGSSTEFAAFLQSDGGRRFLDSLSVEKGHPANRIMNAVQAGLVLTALGVGFFVAGSGVAVNFHRIVSQWDVNGFRVAGSIFASLGIGFLLSAVSLVRAGAIAGRAASRPRPRDSTRLIARRCSRISDAQAAMVARSPQRRQPMSAADDAGALAASRVRLSGRGRVRAAARRDRAAAVELSLSRRRRRGAGRGPRAGDVPSPAARAGGASEPRRAARLRVQNRRATSRWTRGGSGSAKATRSTRWSATPPARTPPQLPRSRRRALVRPAEAAGACHAVAGVCGRLGARRDRAVARASNRAASACCCFARGASCAIS